MIYHVCMKRHLAAALAVVMALGATATVSSQDLQDLLSLVDLDVTIKSLAVGVDQGNYDAPPKFFLLNGSLDSVLEADEASSTVIIEMVTGEWVGLEDVKSYHCLIRFEGEDYFKAFPVTVPRDAGPEVFARSSRIMVVAYPFAVVELADGRLLWLLDGVYLRRL